MKTQNLNNTGRLDTIFNDYKEYFTGSFHTTLWAVFVDGKMNDKVFCFISDYTLNGLQLGIAIANESGYVPCPAYFQDGTTYEMACTILSNMNLAALGLDPIPCGRIEISSMFKEKMF